jgi:selenium-binding protein 1
VQVDANPAGGMQFNESFFVDFGAERPHQIRLEGGDSSSDSFCYPNS